MKKTSYYLVFIVAVGLVLISFWIYQKYFQEEEPALLKFQVERGTLQEIVTARGEVMPQKDFDLGFSFSGTIERVFVRGGEEISRGQALMKLETKEFELDVERLKAKLSQNQTNLEKLLAGSRQEDIKILETKVVNAEIVLEDAKKKLVDKLQDAYTKSEDAVRGKTDPIFDNPRISPRILSSILADSQLKTNAENARIQIEDLLILWKASLDKLTTSSDLPAYVDSAKTNLNQVKSFLEKAALVVNTVSVNTNLSQTTLNTYRSDISTGRTNVYTAISNLSTADEDFRSAQADVTLKENELTLGKAGTRQEDIAIAQAQVKELESQIEITKEKIRKSVLYSPGSAKVAEIFFEEGEFFSSGEIAVSLFASGFKIQSDISELEIGKVREVDGNEVVIQLDAFPGQEFKGQVVSVEPKEIIKEGDKYYRVNIYFEGEKEGVRSGMSADLEIKISFKEDVLKIPELTIYEKKNKKFVNILEGNQIKEAEIETGISNGEYIEVIEGLEEGQTVVVFAD